MFPDPDLVCRHTLLGGVPYFFAELSHPTAQPSCFPKKTGDPNSTMSKVPTTPSTLPPRAPPLAQIVTNTHETGNAASTTSNLSSGLNGAHCFVVGTLPKCYVRNVPLPRVPKTQRARSHQDTIIPDYYKNPYLIPTYDSPRSIVESAAYAFSPTWHAIAINT